jgi:hypothetical protein
VPTEDTQAGLDVLIVGEIEDSAAAALALLHPQDVVRHLTGPVRGQCSPQNQMPKHGRTVTRQIEHPTVIRFHAKNGDDRSEGHLQAARR